MAGSGRGSLVDVNEKATAVKQGRVDLLAIRMAEEGLRMLEKKHGMSGLVEWAMPWVKKIVKEMGLPRKRVF